MKRLCCECLQEGSAARSNPAFEPGNPQWPWSGLTGWAGSRKLLVQDGDRGDCRGPRSPASNPALDRGSSRGPSKGSSSPEKDAEKMDHLDQDRANPFPESDAMLPFRRHRGDMREDRKLRRLRALEGGDLSKAPEVSSSTADSRAEWPTAPQESLVSRVPLRIKVCGQSGGLGISIAGGKGALAYREHDEGIFISKVSEGGPSDRAGIHVGDRLLEVNGVDMQGKAHHQAVSALRKAGSCIKMKVLREKILPIEVCLQDGLAARETGGKLSQRRCHREDSGCQAPKASVDNLPGKVDVVICNGNVPDATTIINQFQVEKNTITIPRIILTHPSTSDDDPDAWSRGVGGERLLSDSDSADVHVRSGSSKLPLHPP